MNYPSMTVIRNVREYAASTAVVMSSVTISVFLKHDLTLEKQCSIGLRSGEYGGK